MQEVALLLQEVEHLFEEVGLFSQKVRTPFEEVWHDQYRNGAKNAELRRRRCIALRRGIPLGYSHPWTVNAEVVPQVTNLAEVLSRRLANVVKRPRL